MRMICALPASAEPAGFKRASVSFDTAGRLPPLLSSVGIESGLAISTDAAMAPCQLRGSTIATAWGRLSGGVEGKIALTAPATSAAGSAPATRVVFFVAETGKPSSVAADLSVDFALISGCPPLDVPLSLREQPVAARTTKRKATASGRGTGDHDNDPHVRPALGATMSLVD